MMRSLAIAIALSVAPTGALAQECPSLSPSEQAAAVRTHVFAGLPSTDHVLVRRGYVMSYDDVRRVPRWAAWHASGDYRRTPNRDLDRWGDFHPDEDVANPVEHSDYNGLHASADNFARGHIVPYFISGGDRDGDGETAAVGDTSEIRDLDDACTLFEINHMSNVAPQYHYRFNGSGGLWNDLETEIRRLIDEESAEHEFHIIAGTIFADVGVQFVGPDGDIGVPDMFYKIVVTDQGPVGFLFAHRRALIGQACSLDAELAECIVPISVIESVSRLDFFSGLPDNVEAQFEAIDGTAVWAALSSN